MNIVNLTPHAITLCDILLECNAENAAELGVTIPPSGEVARVIKAEPSAPYTIPGVPVWIFGPSYPADVEGLPPKELNTVYIVSSIVAAIVRNRSDVFAPGTGPSDGAIRDDKGRIVAVTRLICSE